MSCSTETHSTKQSQQSITADLERDLTASGDFHAMKQQMNLNLISLVRDKYGKIKPFEDPADYDEFLSTIHADLTQQSLQSFAVLKRKCHNRPVGQMELLNADTLRILAIEAELDKDKMKAAKCFVQRTEISPKTAGVWRDLGNFYLRWKNYDQAELAFKEILLDNFIDFEGLLLLGK